MKRIGNLQKVEHPFHNKIEIKEKDILLVIVILVFQEE